MDNLKIVTEIERKKWSDFVSNHPQGNIFQTPEIFEVYKNTQNWEPIFLSVVNSHDEVLGILVTVIQKETGGFLGKFTARAITWGGPLIAHTEEKKEILMLLLGALESKLKKEVIYVQFRNLYDFYGYQECFINNGYMFEDHLDFISDLTIGETELWKKLFSARRNKIRKAKNEGIKIKIADDISEIQKGYDILKKVYSRLKLPLAKKDMFISLYNILFDKNMVSCFMVTFEGAIIGILYLLRYRDNAYVWYAGSSPAYYTKHPNDILYWEAMNWCCNNGYKIFCFGGAGNPNEKYGVREFKKQFGGNLVNYGRFTKIYKPLCMSMVNLGLRLLKLL